MTKSRYVVAMARGTLVIDENVEALAPELEKLNIRVVRIPKGTSDPEIMKNYAANRILVTNNVDDFRAYASSFDMGIIGVSKASMANAAKLAKRISDIIIKQRLWSIRHGFLLMIPASGRSTFTALTE